MSAGLREPALRIRVAEHRARRAVVLGEQRQRDRAAEPMARPVEDDLRRARRYPERTGDFGWRVSELRDQSEHSGITRGEACDAAAHTLHEAGELSQLEGLGSGISRLGTPVVVEWPSSRWHPCVINCAISGDCDDPEAEAVRFSQAREGLDCARANTSWVRSAAASRSRTDDATTRCTAPTCRRYSAAKASASPATASVTSRASGSSMPPTAAEPKSFARMAKVRTKAVINPTKFCRERHKRRGVSRCNRSHPTSST